MGCNFFYIQLNCHWYWTWVYYGMVPIMRQSCNLHQAWLSLLMHISVDLLRWVKWKYHPQPNKYKVAFKYILDNDGWSLKLGNRIFMEHCSGATLLFASRHTVTTVYEDRYHINRSRLSRYDILSFLSSTTRGFYDHTIKFLWDRGRARLENLHFICRKFPWHLIRHLDKTAYHL